MSVHEEVIEPSKISRVENVGSLGGGKKTHVPPFTDPINGLCLGHMREYLRKPINLTIQPSISILSTLVQLLSVVLWKAVQQLKDGPGIGLHQERPLPTIFLSKLTKKRWESGNICFIPMVGC